jgi:hypothetical protein
MPLEGLPVASERQVVRADALGSNERQGNLLDLPMKISRCPLRALHQHATLQIFSTVGNVSFSDKDIKLSKYTLKI